MSEAAAGSLTAAEDQNDFASIASELYGLHPDAFAAARDEQVRKARTAGRQPLARELAQLRRPTLSAWLINLLWRDQREVMAQLFEIADAMRAAQAGAAGAQLRELMAQRRQVEAALMRQARALAEQAGGRVSESVMREAEETLSAALAQPEVAEQVRTGRLTKPATYAGFGPLPAASSGTLPAIQAPAPATRPPVSLPDRAQERAEQRARERREAAERRVREARAALDAANAELLEQARGARAARDAHAARRSEQERLEAQLRDVQAQARDLASQAAEAQRAAEAAERKREQAEQSHAAARRALEAAQAALESLDRQSPGA